MNTLQYVNFDPSLMYVYDHTIHVYIYNIDLQLCFVEEWVVLNSEWSLSLTFGSGLSFRVWASNVCRMFHVHGPSARMCSLSVSSWGADVRVKGWYSSLPWVRQAIRTHCPDLYSNLDGRLNSSIVTSGGRQYGSSHFIIFVCVCDIPTLTHDWTSRYIWFII